MTVDRARDPRLELVARAALDPLAWAKLHTPHAVPTRYAPFHRRLVTLPPPGQAEARVVFRGAAKTTLTRTLVAWAAHHGHTNGVLILRATHADAKGDREALKRVFDLVGVPSHIDGDRGMIVAGGVPIWTRSPGSAVRGLQWTSIAGHVRRPDLIIVDDLETRDTARSATQTKNLAEWLGADALQTAGRGAPARTIMLGTPITAQSLIARAQRREAPFDTWREPLIVPIIDADGSPAWPETWSGRPDVPALSWSTEFLLEPVPTGTLVFPPDRTRWAPTPPRCSVIVAVDPAGDGADATGIVAATMTPEGLHVVDALRWDGPMVRTPDQVRTLVDRVRAAGHSVEGVLVEAVGGWEWAIPPIRDAVQPAPIRAEKPRAGKLERALHLTRWHHAGRLAISEHLRGSPLDIELHSWDIDGITVTGHDDMIDALVWACGGVTRGWRTQPPAAR